MTKRQLAAWAAALAFCGACNEGLSAPSQDSLVAGSTQPLQNLVTGVIADDRSAGSAFSYLLFPEGMARNTLRADPNEVRYVNELIGVPIDNSDFIGGAGWSGQYQVIRSVQELVTSPSLTTQNAGDQAAVAGFVRTIEALEYLREVQLHDSLGAVIQGANAAATDPMRTKTAVLAYTSALLDSAYTQLTASGVSATLPVTLPSGYKASGDFSSTANVAKFNRGLKGEVEVMRGFDHQSPCTTCFATAITALNGALTGLTSSASDLRFGPQYQYNPSAPETVANPLVDNHIYLTDNFVNSIQAGDARSSKIVKASAASSTINGLQLSYRDPVTDPAITSNLTRNIPIRRAADWYLFRAQAEAESGDLAGATADVNAVHTGEGALPAVATFASVAAARSQILYEMRYSLIYEGPFYLVALREYGALTKAYVTQAGMPTVATDPTHASDPLTSVLPIPSTEAVARNGAITPQP